MIQSKDGTGICSPPALTVVTKPAFCNLEYISAAVITVRSIESRISGAVKVLVELLIVYDGNIGANGLRHPRQLFKPMPTQFWGLCIGV